MDRQIPANVLADLARRGLDVGYLDRMALSPFLRADGSYCPVRAYITSGKVPSDAPAQATLRRAAEKAVTWLDSEVKDAGTTLLHLLDATVN